MAIAASIYPFVIRQMAAEQRAVHFADGAFAELPAERGVDGLVAGHHHQTGRAEIQAVRQGAAGEQLYQPVVYRIEILRILAREAEQPGRLIDQRQMIVLIEDLYLVMAWRGDKGIGDRRHRVAGWRVGADDSEFRVDERI